jgi:hypothetical protein
VPEVASESWEGSRHLLRDHRDEEPKRIKH